MTLYRIVLVKFMRIIFSGKKLSHRLALLSLFIPRCCLQIMTLGNLWTIAQPVSNNVDGIIFHKFRFSTASKILECLGPRFQTGSLNNPLGLGFKVYEYRAQTKLLHSCLDFLKENGARGAGMSSWGPALFAFGENLEDLRDKAKGWLAENGGGETILTKANNVGMESVRKYAPFLTLYHIAEVV